MDIFFIFCARYLFLIVFVTAAVYFFLQPRKIQIEILIFGLMVAALSYGAALIARQLYFDPRPFVEGHFKPLIPHDTENGFPSDHVLLVSCVAAVIFLFNRGLSLVLWVLTALIAVARVYTGVHHPIDVVCSAMITIIITAVLYLLIKRQFITNMVDKINALLPWGLKQV